MTEKPPTRLVMGELPTLSERQRLSRAQTKVKELEGENARLREHNGKLVHENEELRAQVERLRAAVTKLTPDR